MGFPEIAKLFDLSHATALVFGGSSGIGKAIAEAFLAYGAEVIIASNNVARLQETKDFFQRTYKSILRYRRKGIAHCFLGL